jgi:hypothetical protein
MKIPSYDPKTGKTELINVDFSRSIKEAVNDSMGSNKRHIRTNPDTTV